MKTFFLSNLVPLHLGCREEVIVAQVCRWHNFPHTCRLRESKTYLPWHYCPKSQQVLYMNFSHVNCKDCAYGSYVAIKLQLSLYGFFQVCFNSLYLKKYCEFVIFCHIFLTCRVPYLSFF